MLAGTSSGRNQRRMPRRSSTRLLLLQTPVARRRRSCSPARRVLPWWCRFFQYGFMYRERRSKLDDKAVPCYFRNAGDNHADCCVKVLRADTGRVHHSSNVTWAPLPQSGGGRLNTAPSAPAPPTPPGVSFEIASTPPAVAGTHSAATALPPPATAGTPSAAATWPPPPLLSPPAHSPSAHTPPAAC